MKTLILICTLALALPAMAAGFTVRDSSGRTIETWQQQGNQTVVRDRSGRLRQTWTPSGNRTEIRDRSGRLLGTVGK